jgi:hypothetical protein
MAARITCDLCSHGTVEAVASVNGVPLPNEHGDNEDERRFDLCREHYMAWQRWMREQKKG